ncbi:hypothetical protein M441DRAFT_330558 [Trichoderma asperellum CBS 433.97]|uniref:Uncharacterized protein n=1 Tax=Trichoderma asperellum (strain ATCC 204424 / CBS 433.97 / NBRC 101777) TaxID=1042311 RepID=A0A2T3YS42_TRIA4|nr:hypothetical protein M441DRAFT_330558 [Trichoderma asperellum CBS 433.97]PTB35393.1 hypothetical protein M441DRAFT_330558 [Trichoderma asperellum CBS 433.97]
MQPRICTVLATPPTKSADGWPAANRRPAPCTMEPLITPPEPFGGTSLALANSPMRMRARQHLHVTGAAARKLHQSS